MKIESRSVGPYDNNAYLLTDGDDVVLVDAAQDADALLAWIGDRHVSTIVTTHAHPDHIAALPAVAAATGAKLVGPTLDMDAIQDATGLTIHGVWDKDAVRVGNVALEVIGLVGHTAGGIALAWIPTDQPAVLITGDSLFPGGVGKTNSPEDFDHLFNDVSTKLFGRFSDLTVVLPGHGMPTTLGTERPHLGKWRERGW